LPLVTVAAIAKPLLFGRRVPARLTNAPQEGDTTDEALRLERLGRERAVRQIGLLNYGLALRALLMLVVALQMISAAGDTWLNPVVDLGLPALAIVVNVVIGRGLRRLRRWARWLEVAWNAVVSAFRIAWASWLLRHGVYIDPATWPEIAITTILPPFLVIVMLLPRTARVVSAEHRKRIALTRHLDGQPVPSAVISAFVWGFLVVLAAVLMLDTLDWAIRIRSEIGA
jgi:hypothetical protein